jgi:hypothetical protein
MTGAVEKGREAVAWAPLVCAAHCVAVPGIALLAPGLLVPEAVEYVLMAVAVAGAALVLGGGLRVHGDRRVLWPVAAGLACWAVALGADAVAIAPPEWVAGSAGGVLLFAGLRWNARLSASARLCGCGYCDDS